MSFSVIIVICIIIIKMDVISNCTSVNDVSTKSGRHRKLEKKWTPEEDTILVAMIEEREEIWNYNSPMYKNNVMRIKSWQEIADKTDHSVTDIKIHWNTVKSRYNSERKKVLTSGTYTSKYDLYIPLQFLSKNEVNPKEEIVNIITRNQANSSSNRSRKLEKKWTAEEDKIMVAMIKEREAIWNITSLLYKDQDLRCKSWIEVADKTNHSITDVKIHWNTVKSRYNSERKKVLNFTTSGVPYQSTYELYIPLQFLSQCVPPNDVSTFNEKKNKNIVDESVTMQSFSPDIIVSNEYASEDTEFIPYPFYKKRKLRSPNSITSSGTENYHGTTILNELSGFIKNQHQVPPKDRWKKIFSEYIFCELDRYGYNDAQNLKTQLTTVCLNFETARNVYYEPSSPMQLPNENLDQVMEEKPSLSLLHAHSTSESLHQHEF